MASRESRPAIVVDVGSAFVRAGYAGEPAPRCVVPSPLRMLQGGGRVLFDRVGWRGVLDEFLGDLFAVELLARPQQHVVLLLENATCPRALREALVDGVLRCRPRGVAFAPALAAAAASRTALVVDVGAAESRCVAVVRGRFLAHTLRVARVGARAVARRLAGAVGGGAGDGALEDLAVRSCFVRRRGAAPPPEADGGPAAAFADLGASVPFGARRSAADALFEADAATEEEGLGALVAACLAACAVEVRKPLAANVLPVGGGAALPGFDARLLDELRARHAAGGLEFAVAYAPFARCDAAWVGGSLLAASAKPGDLPGISPGDLADRGLPDLFSVAGTDTVVAT